jgi:phage terminase large subunit-like protein
MQAKRYCEEVLQGSILACRYVKQACQRHLDDLNKQHQEDFAFYFDEAQAAKVCRFIELHYHPKGRWARDKETIKLEPWQTFIVSSLFGWKRKEDGLRRFRTAYLEIPRKQGKSSMAAAMALYMLVADDEAAAEVYCGATTLKQAEILFHMAQSMSRSNPHFQDAFSVTVNKSNISILTTGSKFEPLVGRPGDGSSPSFYIADEVHEHPDDSQIEAMLTGMGAREQPLALFITTAGTNLAGPCYQMREDVIKTLSSSIQDDQTFGIIYTIDEGMDWTSDEALEMANPNMGVSVTREWLRKQIDDALNSPRRQAAVRTKHLNQWMTSREGWMDMEAWNRCKEDFTASDFPSEPVYIGLDLASKTDITALSMIFKRGDTYYLTGRYYLPESAVNDPANRHYQGWAAQGHLQVTDGDIIDLERIYQDILDITDYHRVVMVGADPWNATHLLVRLQQEGLEAVEVRQTTSQLSEPMKWLEAQVKAGKLRHDGNPALTWMFSNVVVRPDANDNLFPRKTAPQNKIDAVISSTIALSLAQRIEQPTQELRIRTL